MARSFPFAHLRHWVQLICFSRFVQPGHFGWDKAWSIFDLESSKLGSWPRSKPMIIFLAKSWIDIFAVCFVAMGSFWAEIQAYKSIFDLENSITISWPRFDIWGLDLNRYASFTIRGNGIIFGWDIAKSIFDLENSRLRLQWGSQCYGQGQSNLRHLRLRVQSIYLLFVLFQSFVAEK